MKKWQIALVAGVSILGWLTIMALIFAPGDDDPESAVAAAPTTRPTATAKPAPTAVPTPPLTLISATCTHTSEAFIECEGFVRNVSDRPLEDVLAVIINTDASGVPLSSDDALIDYNPILAGQESPWSVIINYNPAYTQWRVEFSELFGTKIAHTDAR